MIRTYPYTAVNQANFTSKAFCLGLLEDDFGERFLWPLGFAVLRF